MFSYLITFFLYPTYTCDGGITDNDDGNDADYSGGDDKVYDDDDDNNDDDNYVGYESDDGIVIDKIFIIYLYINLEIHSPY